jgi:hypothetical protein
MDGWTHRVCLQTTAQWGQCRPSRTTPMCLVHKRPIARPRRTASRRCDMPFGLTSAVDSFLVIYALLLLLFCPTLFLNFVRALRVPASMLQSQVRLRHSLRLLRPTLNSWRPFSPSAEKESLSWIDDELSKKCTTLDQSIYLQPNEERLFALLERVVAEKKVNTTIRVAGGWVRDKLLQHKTKNDIDLAIDNMSGLQFMHLLNAWYEEHGLEKKKFGVIQQNPDKSKHLETGTQCVDKSTTVCFHDVMTIVSLCAV